MKNKTIRLFALLLVLVMCFSVLSACTDKAEEAVESSEPAETEKVEETEEPKSTTPLVVGYDDFSEKFSPFFADSGYDQDVVEMTQVSLLTTDRTGGIVYNAIEGETITYNGVDYLYQGPANVEVTYDEAADQTTYLWTIRDDIQYSDGEVMDADDVIFSFYTLCDPAYVGSTTIYSIPILGINNYRTQTSDEVFAKYDAMFDEILAAGPDYAPTDADSFTQDQADVFWAMNDELWKADVQAIVDYCYANYAAYYEAYAGILPEEAAEGEDMFAEKRVAAGMGLWGFGSFEEGVLTGAVTGNTWDYTAGEYPTLDDYYAEVTGAYADIVEYAAIESPGENAADGFRDKFIRAEGPKDPSLGEEGIPNIAGIKKLSDTEVEITVEGFDAAAIYRMAIQVAPLHYYGDVSKYDYDNNMFGFDFGDLSVAQSKTTEPMGAGPYRFIKYENKVVYFEANENYYKGEPSTYYMQFKVTDGADKIPGVATGTIDISDPSFGTAEVEEISSYNSNGETVGDVINTNTVDNLGYGYVGINAATVNVGGVADSEESKNLRKALATLIAAYRNLSIDSYYGERASIINYPISNTSWAAPQKSDEGYALAFSKTVDGSDIYSSDMDTEAKFEAAMAAAIDYFVAAGYTYDGTTLTAAPDGAKLEYEIIIPGDGGGDHPSFALATKLKEELEKVGMTIILTDPTDSNVLWDKLDAGSQEMWAAAWGATIDPDMYQIYYSNNVVGNEGSSESNHYHIQDAELDDLILEARTSDDQAFRKQHTKSA